MPKPLFLLVTLLLLSFQAFAQKGPSNPFALADSVIKANPLSYLAPLNTLRESRPNPDEEDQIRNSLYGQALSTYHSFAGSYDSAIYNFDRSLFGNPEQIRDRGTEPAFAKDNYFRNALTALPAKLYPQRVVMLNEAHHVPSHRAFALSLLDELHKLGFRHLALEALSAQDTAALHKRGYPVQESGFYLREPLFAEFVREAIRRGFNLVAYESEKQCQAPPGKDSQYCNRYRDSIQALNLATWVNRNPNKKLFVYAGYSHVHELPSGEWVHMAEFFRRFTGINPYTIDQVHMNERAFPQSEDPRYRAVAAQKNIQTPMVAYVEDTLWSHNKAVDATIFHPSYLRKQSSLPRYQLKENRPDFYLLNNRRRPLIISREPAKNNFSSELLPDNTRMILAFYQKEEGNRIPADVVELKRGQTEALLFLYPGAYELVYLNSRGNPLMRRPLVIK